MTLSSGRFFHRTDRSIRKDAETSNRLRAGGTQTKQKRHPFGCLFVFFERETGLEDWSNSQTLINRRFAGLSFSSVPLTVPFYCTVITVAYHLVQVSTVA